MAWFGRFLGTAVTLCAVFAQPIESWGFSNSRPYCEGYFSKLPPEIRSFKETLESRPEWGTITDYRGQRAKRNYYQIDSLKLAQKVLSETPYADQGPRVRALLISWTLSAWIDKRKMFRQWPDDQKHVLAQFTPFFEYIMPVENAYSAEDLLRIRRSMEIFFESWFVREYLATISTFYQRINSLIVARKISEAQTEVTADIVKKLITPSGTLTQAGSLKDAAILTVKTLKNAGTPAEEVGRMLSCWVTEFKRINRVYWKEMVETLSIFRLYAREIGMTEAQYAGIRSAEDKLLSTWIENPDAAQALRREIDQSVTTKALPE